ncbi:MAG: hypothetical protein Kow00120_30040 [Anaerolineae bacterium]
MTDVICVPTVLAFVNELVMHYGHIPRYSPVYLQETTREAGGAPLPRRCAGVRLTARCGDDVMMWFWEGSVYVRGDGQPAFPDDQARWDAFMQVGPLVRDALERIGFDPRSIRPGAIAVPRDLELVQGNTDGVLAWTKGADGSIRVEIDPSWEAACVCIGVQPCSRAERAGDQADATRHEAVASAHTDALEREGETAGNEA